MLGIAASVPLSGIAEQGVLAVRVRSAADQPLSRVRIGTAGDGSTEVADASGRARIRLAIATKPGMRVTLQVVPPPDVVLISPWEGRAIVPSFENESENFVDVIVAARKDKRVLEDASVITAVIAQSMRETAVPTKPVPPAKPTSGFSRPVIQPVIFVAQRGTQPAHGQGTLAQTATQDDPANRADTARQRSTRTALPITEAAAAALGLSRADIARALENWGVDPLTWKLIVLVGRLEFGDSDPFSSVVGDIDGRGISFGPGWWNARDGSLQKLLTRFRAADRKRFDDTMADDREWMENWLVLSAPEALAAVRSHVLRGGGRTARVPEPWRSRFVDLGRHAPFQRIQLELMQPWVERARTIMQRAGLRSNRALAFVFDMTYNQGPSSAVWNALDADREAFTREVGRPPDEQETLLLVAQRAYRRAPEFVRKPIRARRLAFALGQGIVHGQTIDLDSAGFDLRGVDDGEPLPLSGDARTLERLKGDWLPGVSGS